MQLKERGVSKISQMLLTQCGCNQITSVILKKLGYKQNNSDIIEIIRLSLNQFRCELYNLDTMKTNWM